MFDNIRIFFHSLIGSWIKVGNHEFQVAGLEINTSPALLTRPDDDRVRAATKEELERFIKKYRLNPELFPLHAVEQEKISSPFGPLCRVWVTSEGELKLAEQNLILGLPSGTLILWVKQKAENV